MIVSWPDRARARTRALAQVKLLASVASTRHFGQLGSHGLSVTSDLDAHVRRMLDLLRWVTLAAVFLVALARPLTGRLGEPTWTLALAFALYNVAVVALRRYVPWLASYAHVAVLDLLVVGMLYTMAATTEGPAYVLLLLITACAAVASPLSRTLVYTGAVVLLYAVISPTLPGWTYSASPMRDALAGVILIVLASGLATLLVRQLKQAHLTARLNGDKAAREVELNRLRGVFVSSVSHDLRTPLTALRAGLGMVEMSLRGRLRPDEARVLAAARRNSERLAALIDDLLTYHQLEAGVLELAHTRFDLAEVVREAVSSLQPLLDEKQQAVSVELPAPLEAEGDARRLGQAVLNVLANAHQHTPNRTQIHVKGAIAHNELLLTVHDDGPGIPVTELERVFHRFHRLAPAGSGSGLGLAVAQSIVESHGGRMWAESAIGEGTTFYLALPRSASDRTLQGAWESDAAQTTGRR